MQYNGKVSRCVQNQTSYACESLEFLSQPRVFGENVNVMSNNDLLVSFMLSFYILNRLSLYHLH